MKDQPSELTWLVAGRGIGSAVICVEATTDRRLQNWKLRHPKHVRVRVSGWRGPDGRMLDPIEARALRRKIRQRVLFGYEDRSGRRRPSDMGAGFLVLQAADRHGVVMEELLLRRCRTAKYARARGYAAALLHTTLGLSAKHIAELLNYADHKGVSRWLEIGPEILSEPYKRPAKRSSGSTEGRRHGKSQEKGSDEAVADPATAVGRFRT